MVNKETCAECAIWKPENLDVNPVTQSQGFNHPGKTDYQYGKCRASFFGNDGELKVWELVTLGSNACSALDDNDKPLFTPKVQGETSTTG